MTSSKESVESGKSTRKFPQFSPWNGWIIRKLLEKFNATTEISKKKDTERLYKNKASVQKRNFETKEKKNFWLKRKTCSRILPRIIGNYANYSRENRISDQIIEDNGSDKKGVFGRLVSRKNFKKVEFHIQKNSWLLRLSNRIAVVSRYVITKAN